jgi:diguanylate cyclase (GGDEF)-like protein/putative nucleotidyltransferase with HDIG domain
MPMLRAISQFDPPLRARLRLTNGSATGVRIVEDKALMARTFAYLFAIGATLLMLTLLLPGAPDRSTGQLMVIGGDAYLISALLLLAYDRLPLWVFRAMPIMGSALVALALVFGGDQAIGAYAFYYFWVSLVAFYFFDLPWAVVCSAAASFSYAVVLVTHQVQLGPLKWLMLSGALFVGGAVVGRLRSRAEHLLMRLAEAARTDVLTGLANRGEFDINLRQETARAARAGLDFGLISLNIDHFRPLNDRHGHHAGDLVLERVAQVLRTQVRESDTVARTGDDVFAVIVSEAGQAETYLLAERIRKSVREACAAQHHEITVSAGVAIYGKHGGTMAELTAAGEQALLAAKRLGRDRTVIFSEEVASNLIELGFEAFAVKDLPTSLESVIWLAELVDVNQMGSARHSQVVGRYAEAMGERIGMGPDDVERLRIAGILHDIGKIGIAGSILSKPGPLTEEEWRQMRAHPEIGARIARNAGLTDIAVWIGAHHERPDGRGYPRGLYREQIPLQARILAVADAFEAMTNDRPYSPAMAESRAREELEANAGRQFDTEVVEAFLSLLDEGAFDLISANGVASADGAASADTVQSSVDAKSTK